MSEGNMNDARKEDSGDPGGVLRRAYAATPRDEPPPALDAAILAQARAAAGKPATRTGSRMWAPPLALAAMLVVSASLVMLMESEQPQTGVLAPLEKATVGPAAQPPGEAGRAAESAQAPVPPLAGVAPARERRDQAVVPRDAPRDSTASEQRQLADAAPAPQRARDSQAFPGERTLQSNATITAAPPATAATEVPSAPAAPTAPPAALARLEGSPRQSLATSSAAAGGAGPGAASAQRRSPQARDGELRASEPQTAAKREQTPEAWLASIAELRKQGRVREAEESLAEFRKRYPEYPIPPAKAGPAQADQRTN